MSSLLIVKPGLLTTVQDAGRWGYQRRGVSPAGPMDSYSYRAANRLVGNDAGAACLEITLLGPEIAFDEACWCAVGGADFELWLDESMVSCHEAFQVAAGSRLRFGHRRRGVRAYLAVCGGLNVPLELGSRSTHLPSRMGGMHGRPLKEGDALEIPASTGVVPPTNRALGRGIELPDGGAALRVLPGPHDHLFDDEARAVVLESRYTISPDSNRMGYRLQGMAVPQRTKGDMISDATPLGAIQVPPSGQPILLMADRATSGGYPLIATVITADVSIAGQLAPGDWVAFRECSRAEAMAALIAQERTLF